MDYEIKISEAELNVIGSVLTRTPLPYVAVAPLIEKINVQVREQDEARRKFAETHPSLSDE